MVSSVTIGGSNHQDITLHFDSTSNFAVAQQLAAFLTAQVADGTLVTNLDTGGGFPALPSGTTGAYIQTTAPLAVLPTGYNVDLITKPGDAMVFGSGAANQVIMSDSKTNLTFVATGGSGTVVAGGGTSRLMISAGPDQATDASPATWSLSTGDGNDFISLLGDVAATVGAGGGTNTLVLGGGPDLVVSTGNDMIIGSSGPATIDATNAKSDYVQGGAANLLFVGGTGGATILGGTGSDTYMGSTSGPVGKQFIEGGSAGHNYLFAGDGQATLVGGGQGDQLYAFGSSNQWLVAGAGNETLSAALSYGQDTLTAGSGKDLLIGATGSDTFVGGSGHATVNASLGNNVFEFIKNQSGGTELITGVFDPSAIHIDLVGYDASEAKQALASATVHHGSVTIGLTDGTKITFNDVGSLSKSNFI